MAHVFVMLALVMGCGDKDDDGGAGDSGAATDGGGTDGGGTDGGGTDGGDSGTAGECPDLACGGDPVGTWAFADACADASGIVVSECPDAVVEVRSHVNTGEATLGDDGRYRSNTHRATVLGAVFPDSCLGGATCGELAVSIGAACTEVSGGCDCEVSDASKSSDAGTWEVSGSVLTTRSDDGDVSTVDFCVDGTSLWFGQAQDNGLYTTVSAVPEG